MKIYNLNKDKLIKFDEVNHVWIMQSGRVHELVDECNLVIRTGYVYRCDSNGHISPLKSTIRKNGIKPSWIQLGKYFGFDTNWTDQLAANARYFDVPSHDVKFESFLEFG